MLKPQLSDLLEQTGRLEPLTKGTYPPIKAVMRGAHGKGREETKTTIEKRGESRMDDVGGEQWRKDFQHTRRQRGRGDACDIYSEVR